MAEAKRGFVHGLRQNRDRVDLDEVVGMHHFRHLDHRGGGRRRLEVFAAHLVDRVEVLHVAYIYVDAADVVQAAAGRFHGALQVLAYLARLRLDVADAGDGPVGAARGHAGEEHDPALRLDLDRLREVTAWSAQLGAPDLSFAHYSRPSTPTFAPHSLSRASSSGGITHSSPYS